MGKKRIKVLLIEDDPGHARLIEIMLSEVKTAFFDIECVDRLVKGVKRLAAGDIDAVLLDLGLPDSSGLDTFTTIHAQGLDVPIIVLSGLDDEALALEAVCKGAQDYLAKDQVESNLLGRAIHYAIERKQAEKHIEHVNSVLKAIKSVTQIITTGKDVNRLLQRCCNALTEARGYEATWLGFLRDNETFTTVVGSGLKEDVSLLVRHVMAGDYPACITNAISQDEPLVVVDKSSNCGDCFFKNACTNREATIVRLVHSDRFFGLLAILFAPYILADEEEKALLKEVASDIALALHNMEMEKLQKQAEEKLRHLSKDREEIFQALGNGTIIIDSRFNIIDANRAIIMEAGKPRNQLLGSKCYKVFHQTEQPVRNCPAMQIINTGSHVPVAREIEALGGHFLVSCTPVFNDRGDLVKMIESSTNITEHKRLEEQFRHSQKMEAIGTLAGGVAHDFNNILTAIQGYTDISLMAVAEDDILHRNLTEILKASIRAANLTRQLLLFSRRQPMEMMFLGLNRTIQDLTKMLHRLIGEDISLSTDLDPELWTIKGDAGTMEQTITNLVVNARDAMPYGGKIAIETHNVCLDEEYCCLNKKSRPGEFISLSVRDTGEGMNRAVIERIFDPFFTTKELGKGTGMGLSVVYGIVKKHDGWIDVESSPGNGTVFNIYLPAVSMKAEEIQKTPAPVEPIRGKGERVLLVEDEEAVRRLVSKALSRNGYVVFAAANAKEAMDIFQKEEGNFDLVFTDVILPGERGPEFVKRLLKVKPGMKVLFTSGYSDEKSDWHTIREGGHLFLQKPYSLSDLFRIVRTTLKG